MMGETPAFHCIVSNNLRKDGERRHKYEEVHGKEPSRVVRVCQMMGR